MKTSISDYESYKNICKQAAIDEQAFNSFKTHGDFTPILEHVSYQQGQEYINYIVNSPEYTQSYLDSIRANDIFGGTKLESYQEPFNSISPTTLRYFKVGLELKEMFGDLSGKTVVEIGGGYGGQCLTLNKLYGDLKYTIIDLPEVLDLAKTYLGRHNVQNVEFKELEDLHEPINSDLVISNYAISECSKFVQKVYIQQIIKNATNGYITYNNISHLFNVSSYTPQEFKELVNAQEKVEIPQTGANIIYYW